MRIYPFRPRRGQRGVALILTLLVLSVLVVVVSQLAVARLTAGGLPDTTWSPTGVVTTALGATGWATAIAPSASGFVVAGRRADAAMGNAYLDVVVARYTGGP